MGVSPTGTVLPRFDGWDVIEKLGMGGMCEVYRAKPVDEGPERAIKLLTDRSDVSIRRFIDEATLLQRIEHPNVVRVHAIAADERPPWLVMDLLGGRDLDETMNVEGPMDPERAARLFADLADGLAAVHAAGVRHRDIKPANIRLGTDGVARLIDFGIARDASAARYTKQGFVVGTASYLPPEIFVEDDAHKVQDSETADVYALGQTLCEVLAGRVVHQIDRGSEAGLLVRIMKDKLDREHLDPRQFGAKIPEDLAQLVARATAREPERRTQTAQTFATELRNWLLARTSASAAPISRVDIGHVSLPPAPSTAHPKAQATPARSEPPAAPRRASTPPPAPSSQKARTPPPAPPAAPPKRSRGRALWVAAYGAIGALGMAGTATIAAVLGGIAVVGMLLLWFFRPVSDPDPAKIREAVAALQPTLTRCGGKGQANFSLAVQGGAAKQVRTLSSTFDRRTERCVVTALQAARYPQTKPLTVEVPLVVK